MSEHPTSFSGLFPKVKTIYTKEDCLACMQLKIKLFSKNIPYEEIMIGRDITREDFITKFPTVKSIPHMVETDDKV